MLHGRARLGFSPSTSAANRPLQQIPSLSIRSKKQKTKGIKSPSFPPLPKGDEKGIFYLLFVDMPNQNDWSFE
jgi:hypothetical protein